MGRGLAALAVVLLHAEGMLLPATSSAPYGFGGLFRYGFLGVDFFFVLSGFIIYFVHANHIGKPNLAVNYLCRRLFRILPAYWFVLILLLTLLPFQKTWPEFSLNWFTQQFTLTGQQLWIGQAWTLQHEFLFYAFFLLLILLGRGAWIIMLSWVAACVYVSIGQAVVPRKTWFDIFFHPYHVMFISGICTAIVAKSTRANWLRYSWLVAGLLGISSWMLIYRQDTLASHSALRYYCSAALSTAALVVLISLGRTNLRFPTILTWLGKVSYAMYIAHGIIFMVIQSALKRSELYTHIAPWIIFVTGTLICVAVSGLIQRLVEEPGIHLGRRAANWLTNKKQLVPPAP